jgi:hypothetical protein
MVDAAKRHLSFTEVGKQEGKSPGAVHAWHLRGALGLDRQRHYLHALKRGGRWYTTQDDLDPTFRTFRFRYL